MTTTRSTSRTLNRTMLSKSAVREMTMSETDLNKCSENNVDRPDGKIPGWNRSRRTRLRNLNLTTYEDVVFCPTHVPEQSTADCVYCHARRRQLIERADSIRNETVEEIRTRGVQKVFEPLASAKQIPMDMWK